MGQRRFVFLHSWTQTLFFLSNVAVTSLIRTEVDGKGKTLLLQTIQWRNDDKTFIWNHETK